MCEFKCSFAMRPDCSASGLRALASEPVRSASLGPPEKGEAGESAAQDARRLRKRIAQRCPHPGDPRATGVRRAAEF